MGRMLGYDSLGIPRYAPPTFDELEEMHAEQPTEPEWPKTEELRDAWAALGLRYTEGYVMKDDVHVNVDSVTTLWVDDDPMHTLTFDEDGDGNLVCYDAMSVAQAVAAALAGREVR